VFVTVVPRGHVLLLGILNKLGLRNAVVLADAAIAIESEFISWQTTADDALAGPTRDVRDAGQRRAVLAKGRVGRQGENTATTFFFFCKQTRQTILRSGKGSTYSFRDHEQCRRTPMHGDHRWARHRLTTQDPCLCKSRCRPSSSFC
jgi:hypothetical protein